MVAKKKTIQVNRISNNISNSSKGKNNSSDDGISEIMYKLLLDETPISIICFDKEGIINYVNDYHVIKYGGNKVSKEFYLGKNILELPGIVKAGIVEDIKKIFAGKKIELHSVYFPEFISGESGFINVRGVPIFKKSEFIGGVVTREDVTILKKVEHELSSSKEHIKNIIDNANELIASVDKKGNITAWNSALAKVSAISSQKAISMNVFESNFSNEIKSFIDIIIYTLRSEKTEMIEHEIIGSLGNSIVLLSDTSIIRSDDGSINGVVVIGRDITLKNSEAKSLLEGNSYLITKSLSDTLDRYVKMFESKGLNSLFIVRTNPSIISKNLYKKSSLIHLSESNNIEFKSLINPYDLLIEINSYITNNKKSLIVIEGAEYISMVFGFNSFLRLLYKVNDQVRNTKSILVLFLQEGFFSENEMSMIRHEIPYHFSISDESVSIDDKKMEILKYVSNKNILNSSVSYGSISSKFSLSRITTKKWLNELLSNGLIKSKKVGKQKIVQVTEKGSKIIKN